MVDVAAAAGIFFPFLFFIVVVGILIFIGVMIIWVVKVKLRVGGGRKPGPEPTCGRCGYAVTGLTTFVCPECGVDLREVGIIPAAKSRASAKTSPPPLGASATRTVTILLTDMKDFTSRAEMSSRDDALKLLRRQRDIVQPIVQRRAGRIIKSTGDGLIAAFDSATDALLAGLEVQEAVALHNSQSFTERDKFQLRVAVSTGEVAFAENDVLGQPVNLASRVQQLAAAGDVVFTDSTFHAMNRTEINAEPLGPVEVKGVAGTVNLYRCVRPASLPIQQSA